MLVWSAQVTRAQTFEKQLKASLTGQQELTSASAAVIQGKRKRIDPIPIYGTRGINTLWIALSFRPSYHTFWPLLYF